MGRPTPFEVRQESDGTGIRLSLVGELDIRAAEILSPRVDEILARGATELTLDLRELAFLDSTGLRVLLELHNRAERERWALRLVPPEHEAAVLVLRATGADAALPFVAPPS